MEKYMAELAARYIAAEEEMENLRHEMIFLVRNVDEKHRDNARMRQIKMKEVQRSFYREFLASGLRKVVSLESHTPADLKRLADHILDKRVFSKSGYFNEMRTPQEEKMYTALRVRWTRLLKEGNVDAADPRGGG